MLRLSVIIPIFNNPQRLLEHCLSSVQENLKEIPIAMEPVKRWIDVDERVNAASTGYSC